MQGTTQKEDDDGESAPSGLSLDALEPTHPSALRKRVHFSAEDASRLVWPVLFLYPEHGETDFVEEFDEGASFSDHLEVMFGGGVEDAPWDREGKYRAPNLRLYYEDEGGCRLRQVDPGSTLGQALKLPGYCVLGGTPGFIVMVEGSDFQKDFLKKYRK